MYNNTCYMYTVCVIMIYVNHTDEADRMQLVLLYMLHVVCVRVRSIQKNSMLKLLLEMSNV